MSKTHITSQQVNHIAHLANIPVSQDEEQAFATAFSETLEVIDELQQVDISGVEPTHQVTGLENVWRDDIIDEDRMLSQKQAVAGATQTAQGFFVVPQVIDQETNA